MSDKPKYYAFSTDALSYSVETKGQNKRHFVTGYISTKDRDIVNDIVTETAMKGMLQQLLDRPITMDLEHEAFRGKSTNIVPVARIVESKKDNIGIWVKAEVNPHNNRFSEVWNSIKDKFITAFSIAYKPVKFVYKNIDGVKTRLLENIELLNVTLTGVPVNPHARITSVMVKSLIDLENTEETNMKQETKSEEPPVEEPEKKVEEPKTEEKVEEPKKEETPTEAKSDESAELKSKVSVMETNITELKGEIKSLKEQLEKPMLKALNTGSIPSEAPKPTDADAEKKEEATSEEAKASVKPTNPLDVI